MILVKNSKNVYEWEKIFPSDLLSLQHVWNEDSVGVRHGEAG